MKSKIELFDIAEKLPPVIARSSVEKFLGGSITSKYLANLDSLGKGPKRFRFGRKVIYRTEDLLEWIAERSKVLS